MSETRLAIIGILAMLGPFLMWKVLFSDKWRAGNPSGKMQPQVSVVIPARNEAHRIVPLLESLKRQTVGPHEIIVVIVLYALAVNLPCVIVQRYNRPRLLRIIASTTPEVSNGGENGKR